jgi:hypothetical protein
LAARRAARAEHHLGTGVDQLVGGSRADTRCCSRDRDDVVGETSGFCWHLILHWQPIAD